MPPLRTGLGRLLPAHLRRIMMRLLYNLLFPVAFVILLPGFLLRMIRRGNFRKDFPQRLARYSPDLQRRFGHGEWIWVHAVSVGELLVALKVVDELHRRHPQWQFAVSSTTSTAHALAAARKGDWLVPVYTPLDFPPIVRRALDAVRPRAVILTESEMWPNFVWTASRRKIPVLLINARVSPRSERRYRRFAPVLRSVTQHLSAVGVQEPEHTSLWSHLGVPSARLHLTGSVKYDPPRPRHPRTSGKSCRRGDSPRTPRSCWPAAPTKARRKSSRKRCASSAAPSHPLG